MKWRISWEAPGGRPFGFIEVTEAETIEEVVDFFDSGIEGIPPNAIIASITTIPSKPPMAPDLVSLGPWVQTQAVAAWALQEPANMAAIHSFMARFRSGDFGTACGDDLALNHNTIATCNGANVMGVYPVPWDDTITIWIICAGYGQQEHGPEACYTTVLFPEDY